jgi:hypothetical protein
MKHNFASQLSLNLFDELEVTTKPLSEVITMPNGEPSNGHKITDSNKFRAFAKAHGDKTQTEMAEVWEEEISARTISRALPKIGFTRKKRRMATGSGTKLDAKHL